MVDDGGGKVDQADRGGTYTLPDARTRHDQRNRHGLLVHVRLAPKPACTRIVTVVGCVDHGRVSAEAGGFQRVRNASDICVKKAALAEVRRTGRHPFRVVPEIGLGIHELVLELMLIGHNWFPPEVPPRGHHHERWFHADGRGAERIEAYWRNAGDTKGAAQTWHSELPLAWHNSTWTADRAIDWLHRERTGPFCAWVSFPDPHHSFDCPLPWSRLHSPSEVDLPRFRERSFEDRPWWHERVLTAEPQGPTKSVETHKKYSRIGQQSDEQLREIIANTYGQIALIDHNVGRLLIALEKTGLAENTVVIYFSDHGDWLGDHGLVLKVPMHYDGLLRVPLIVSGPGIPAGKVATSPVSTIDLFPTLVDYADIELPESLHGTSLRPVIKGDAGRSYALNEWELLPGRAGVALSLRTVRTGKHRMTMDMNSGAGELYDLESDLWETRNIFDEPLARGLRNGLEGMILDRPDDMLPVGTPVGMA